MFKNFLQKNLIFLKSVKSNAGFALLMASLLSTLMLSIGTAVFNLSLKELILSSGGRESQFAFYAADTGTECALYWDLKENSFATSSTSNINCNEQVIENVGGSLISTFTFNFSPDPYCATVTVIKNSEMTQTTIESRGYNTCDISNPRRVERGIKVSY